jgi:hypothetical protein
LKVFVVIFFKILKRIVSPVAFEQQVARLFFKVNRGVRAFGVKDKIVSFMLPLGYSFTLDGSMMYDLASIYSTRYGIDLDLGTQMTMLLVLMLTR